MNNRRYRSILRDLKSYEDIKSVAKKYSIDEETVLVIYTQKVIRDTQRNFYKAKIKAEELAKTWSKGEKIIDLSEKYGLPPVIIGNLILTQAGLSRREYNNLLKNPEKISDEFLREEFKEILKKDPLYSPEGNSIQRNRGYKGEDRIKEWLDRYNIKYLREDDLKGEAKKTPDFLLKNPIEYRGEKIHWIESKGSFGDNYEIKRNLTKQLKPYLNLFGGGTVVYWYGVLDEIPMIEGIVILSGKDFLRWDPTL